MTCLREVADRAAAWGVSLAIQNHNTLAVSSELFRQFILEVERENCRDGFDAWSPFLRGEDIVTGTGRLAPHAIMSIAANYRTYHRYRYVPEAVNYQREELDVVRGVSMTEGAIDFTSFFMALKNGGFEARMSMRCAPLWMVDPFCPISMRKPAASSNS